jgi:hypothetical protein
MRRNNPGAVYRDMFASSGKIIGCKCYEDCTVMSIRVTIDILGLKISSTHKYRLGGEND